MSSKSQQVLVKRIPQRTCIACRQVKAKRELIRLVHLSDGRVEVDASGRKSGRGAYLCRAVECWEAGLKGGRLEYALKVSLDQRNREELSRCALTFCKELSSGAGERTQ